jgi:purine-binding chemotaxis protein CheW
MAQPFKSDRRADKLLAERARRLAREIHPEADSRAEVEWLTFWVSKQLFGIPLAQAEGVIRLQKLIAVPGAPSYLPGLVRVQQKFIALVDLRELLLPEGRGITDATKVVAARAAHRQLGFAVSDLHDVIALAEAQVAAAPLANDGLSRSLTVDGKSVALIDLNALARDARLDAPAKLDGAETRSAIRKV